MCPADALTATPIEYSRLTRKQAERIAGVSRATLARYVADGKLSTHKDAQGQNRYDAAELQRVFPESFNLKRLETPASSEGVSPDEAEPETLRDSVALASLTVEKRYLTEERDRLREEAERLRRELADERAKRENERSDFMKLIQQNQETVKQLTDQSQKEANAPSRPRGFLDRLLNREPR
jgi:hypothetical protein